jgi:hypothetical protein
MSSRRGRRNRIKHFLIETTKSLFEAGIGKSKYEAFQESYKRNETRQSPVIYTFSTENRYEKVVANFADFLKQEYGLEYEREFRKLSTEELYTCVDRYFEKQQEKNRSESTLKLHISALNKVLSAIDPNIKEYFDADSRARWRDGVPRGDNDRYNNPDKIVENLHKINETSEAIAQLQRLTGARIGDVKKIEIDDKNKKVNIKDSKGGRSRSVYFDRFPDQFEKVKEYKEILDRALEEKKFSDIREDEYYNDLRKACRKAGEPYRASHAFRFEWAQEKHKEISQWSKEEQETYYRRILEERGKSEKDINKAINDVKERDLIDVAIISEELGHSRIDISLHYLKIKRK